MGATFFLLRRYLLPERANLLGLALWISVAGVSLGIVLLMLVLSVMSGFQKLLRDSYTRITSEIVVIPKVGKEGREALKRGLSGEKSVQAFSPFSLGQGMILKEGVGGVMLEGVDAETSDRVTPWGQIWVAPPLVDLQKSNRYWMWMGVQLARKLQVKAGDTVNVLIADGENRRVIPFVVTALTKFGIYDHDMRYAHIDLKVLLDIFRHLGLEPMYKVKVAPGAEIGTTADRLKELLGVSATVKQWSEINQNVFLAVEHQKQMLFLVLEIVVALAAMNVVNLLMMSSHQRRRDVAILRAMGMRLKHVFLFFVAQGAAVGSAGILVGVGLGVLVCRLVERFQPTILSEAIYNVNRLPIRIETADVALICGIAFLLCVLFSVLPALRAALSSPVNALRYE